ncbi:MAG: beta-N-acetylhexosaminidase [Bacteroidota bacterium]
MKSIAIFVFLILLVNLTELGAQMKTIQIIPTPQKINYSEGEFKITSGISIHADENLQFSSDKISRSIKEKFGFDIVQGKSNGSNIRLEILAVEEFSIEQNPEKLEEAYRLVISQDQILIEAVTSKGIFYGAMSLIQLIDNLENNSLPAVEIEDWPDLKIRGISDDISRGQVSTIENFKRIIDFIARYKMNTYMPYMEDILELKSFPSIGKNRGALTRQEVKEIIEFAAVRYVEVIPIFQTLGHFENVLVQEEFLDYAEFPGAASLNVSDEKTYEFLEKMLDEVFEIFPSKYFHMGADESYDVGYGKSRHLVEKSSLAKVHADHYKKVYDICKKNGKEVLMYGDIILNHPEILEMLPEDITIVDWHYRGDFNYPSVSLFSGYKFNYFVSPSVWNFLTTFPANINAIPNIEYITKAGIENGASGMINSNWGDYGAETFKELVLYGYALSAQYSWSFSQSDLAGFNQNYFRDFFGTQDSEANEIYSLLGNPLNQMLWHNVWRHPLLNKREPAWWEPNISDAARIKWMQNNNHILRSKLKTLKLQVKRNADHLDILAFLIDLNEWYVLKLETSHYLNRLKKLKELTTVESKDKKETERLTGAIQNEIKNVDLEKMIRENIAFILKLKESYRGIWLKHYKPDNLNMIEDKFDRLISYFEETLYDYKANSVRSPLLESEWIYCPNGADAFASKAVFKKEFEIAGVVNSAQLQLMGDTYAKLFINGNYVEQVYARRTLSLLVDYDRIKFIDITDHLKAGKNTIEVSVESYYKKAEAGCNVIAEIITDETEIIIKTDTTWQAKKAETDKWLNGKSKAYPYTVISPNFKTKRTSWIER